MRRGYASYHPIGAGGRTLQRHPNRCRYTLRRGDIPLSCGRRPTIPSTPGALCTSSGIPHYSFSTLPHGFQTQRHQISANHPALTLCIALESSTCPGQQPQVLFSTDSSQRYGLLHGLCSWQCGFTASRCAAEKFAIVRSSVFLNLSGPAHPGATHRPLLCRVY